MSTDDEAPPGEDALDDEGRLPDEMITDEIEPLPAPAGPLSSTVEAPAAHHHVPTGLRAAALPVIAAALVSGVLGVQVANGGGDFAPARAADPCAPRVVTSVSTGIDGLGERLVLLGLDGAGCRLGMTREALLLELALPGTRTDAQIEAMRAGLLQAVDRMKADGSLPKASDLSDEALQNASLPGFVKTLIRHLPDSLINSAVKMDDVLRRTINDLDLRALLDQINNPDEITRQVNAAVSKAVKDSLIARLRDLLP